MSHSTRHEKDKILCNVASLSMQSRSISHSGGHIFLLWRNYLTEYPKIFSTGSCPVHVHPTAAGHWAAPLEKRIKCLPQWQLREDRALLIHSPYPDFVWGSELVTVWSQMHSLLTWMLFLGLLLILSLFGQLQERDQHCPAHECVWERELVSKWVRASLHFGNGNAGKPLVVATGNGMRTYV